jgi:ATP-binding protein involved in chromosome partitioning
MMLTRENIVEALAGVRDPARGLNVVEARMISGITLKEDGRVGFLITIAPGEHREKAWLRAACERAVAALSGVSAVTAVLTAEGKPDESKQSDSSSHQVMESPGRPKAQWNTEPLAHVRRLIAVASGKGGVGKSTTSVNLAHALCGGGRRVGLLDADVTGPSIPRMMGLTGVPEVKDGRIIPPLAHGIRCMSMGLLVGQDSALVWRGPQLSKALAQMLRGVEWGTQGEPLDMLLIDMPPGTGDIHLSLAQQAPLSGAIIVTTPQEVAVADARKCIDMFRKVRVPVLGVIENMSGFSDPATRTVHAIFGAGGGRRLAESQNVPFLGEVPIEIALREASDAGSRFEDKTGIYRQIVAGL